MAPERDGAVPAGQGNGTDRVSGSRGARTTAELRAPVASTEVDATPKGRERDGWSMLGTIRGARGMVRSFARNTTDGLGGLAELAAMAQLRDELEAAIDACALHLLAEDDASYREIGIALNITPQAAAKRFPGASTRPPGGQSWRFR